MGFSERICKSNLLSGPFAVQCLSCILNIVDNSWRLDAGIGKDIREIVI